MAGTQEVALESLHYQCIVVMGIVSVMGINQILDMVHQFRFVSDGSMLCFYIE